VLHLNKKCRFDVGLKTEMDTAYIASLRNEYKQSWIDPTKLSNDPIVVFKQWFDFAIAESVHEPNAMVLATTDAENKPHARIVLMKDVSTDGVTFFTNYLSQKGQELEKNPHAALTFFWPELERQVRIEGSVSKTSVEESDAYFAVRPRLSQAGAIASAQSTEIADRDHLEQKMNELMALPETQTLQRPIHWGGFILKPVYFEFWQGRPGRVHDRICYEGQEGTWRRFRKAP
jgi:pyridoxamine 5'-phosphate oxidase